MSRFAIAKLVALCAGMVGVYLLIHSLPGRPTVQLRLVGYTNAPSGTGRLAMLALSNLGRHTIYLSGASNGPPCFNLEVEALKGWRAVDSSARPMTDFTWGVGPKQSYVFGVPMRTNPPEAWRVTVRYFDGAVYSGIPVLGRILPGGGPTFRLPGKGSGRYREVSTDTLPPQP